MSLERGFGKRGQEGLTLTTLLLIVLGVVVVIVVILGFTTGFGFITNIFNNAPGKSLEVAIQACTLAAQSSLTADYCLDFKNVEINGANTYVTCDYLEMNNYLGEVSYDCSGLDSQLKISEFCTNKNLKGSQRIQGTTCDAAKE